MPKAIQFHQFGTKDVLEFSEIDMPRPKNNEVLIKVHAAALNPIDYKIRNGTSFVANNLALPSGLGFELSGKIVEIGNEIKNLKVGDQAFGIAGFPKQPGCQAEYVCRTPEPLVYKPDLLSHLEAACLPITGLTALQALEIAKVKSGQNVLIHAGSGGVGHIAIQLAKQMGAYVYTTASKQNHEFLRALGADQCIDYKEQDFANVINRPVDVIIDLIGGEIGVRSLEILKPEGVLITIPTITAEQVVSAARGKGLQAKGMLMELNTEQLSDFAQLVVDKKLMIKAGVIYQLSEAQQAHQERL